MPFKVITGDSLKVLPTLAADSFDSIVTDPPYHLTTGKKGGTGAASVNLNTPAGRARVTAGFMGMTWDGGDIAQSVELWAEALRVLKPGGYLLAFSGSRTYHRMVCAIEDAGFEIRDQIMWVYGSGFPKGTDKSKIPPEWKGWNTALKPAHEPIVLARKPMGGTLAENLLAHGTGALNIDECRIEAEAMPPNTGKGALMRRAVDEVRDARPPEQPHERGRWPANLIHDGSDEVVRLFPADAGAAGPVTVRNGDKFRSTYGAFAGNIDEAGSTFQGDSGSAARFFYEAKASAEDRNEGCDDLPAVPFGAGNQAQAEIKRGNLEHSGKSGINTVSMRRNNHPTVKPTDLMRYLCRLVTPKGGHVLDVFCGSGSTGRGAVLEGFDFTGIELGEDYAAIARARIDFAYRQGHQHSLLDAA